MTSFINALVGLVTLGVIVGGPIWLIFHFRGQFLRSLDGRALGSLVRVTQSLFDETPKAYADQSGAACVEGTRDSETVAVRAAFTRAANGDYMRRGYKEAVSAETSVVMGLKGATPKLSLVPHGEAPSLEIDFNRAFRADVDPDLLDDVTKALIMDFLARGPRVRDIRVDAEGLHVTWGSSAGLAGEIMSGWSREALVNNDEIEAEQIALVMDFTKKLRARILEVVERRALGAHVRVEAYRAAEPLEEPDAEEAERHALEG